MDMILLLTDTHAYKYNNCICLHKISPGILIDIVHPRFNVFVIFCSIHVGSAK